MRTAAAPFGGGSKQPASGLVALGATLVLATGCYGGFDPSSLPDDTDGSTPSVDARGPSDGAASPDDGADPDAAGPDGDPGADGAPSEDAVPGDGDAGAGPGDAASDGTGDAPDEPDVADGGGADGGAADGDAGGDGDGPIDCTAEGSGLERTITLRFGETLYFDGDDKLAFWGSDHPCDVTVVETPAEASAEVRTGADGAQRLTPDVPGLWRLRRGPDRIEVQVDDDWLDESTFQNYNYSPTEPLVRLDPDDGPTALWVASPPSSAVQRVVVEESGAEPAELVPTGGWPTALAHWEGGDRILVAQTARDSLGFLDPSAGRLVDAIRVGNEPAGLELDEAPDGTPIAWVAISGDNRVARVDLEAKRVTDVVPVERDPRAMWLDAERDRLYVASLISSNSHPRGTEQEAPVPVDEQEDVAVIDTSGPTVVDHVHAVGTILRGLYLREDTSELLVALSRSNNQVQAVEADSNPHSHGLAVVDAAPDSLSQHTVVEQIDLDDQPSSSGPAASPFSIDRSPGGGQLLVTLSAGEAVLALDPGTYEELGRLPTGSDPRGLVFAAGRMWTYAWLDNALQGWPTGEQGDVPLDAASPEVSVAVGDDPTPPAVKEGQRMFNDASFSKNDDFSCQNCHIDGNTDGLVWNLLTDGPVNTLDMRNLGGTGPFLWGAKLPTLFDFSREVLKLVGAEASGEQMQKLTTYMQSITEPPNPYNGPGGQLTEKALQGEELFHDSVLDGGAGCGSCHSGPLLTNRELLSGKTEGVETDVPSLLGAYDTGPYGREGQWKTLPEMVDYATSFTGADLDAEQKEALVAYVRQQPASELYLVGTEPLDESDHVAPDTSLNFRFSGVLRPGQHDRFELVRLGDAEAEDADEPGEPVPGTWTLDGRRARFEPDEPLALNSAYAMRAEGGVESRLGKTTSGPFEVRFTTGGNAEVNVSGEWHVQLSESSLGVTMGVDISFLQSDGGQVTGVVVDDVDQGSLDHLQGHVSGTTLVIEPFHIQSDFGPLFVENGITAELTDTNDDGYADEGTGQISFDFSGDEYLVDVLMTRNTLPMDGEEGAGADGTP